MRKKKYVYVMSKSHYSSVLLSIQLADIAIFQLFNFLPIEPYALELYGPVRALINDCALVQKNK